MRKKERMKKMSSKVEKTKNANEVKIEVTVEASKFDEAIKRVYFQSAKYFNIPGFRKGKAPLQIVEKYYGKEIFYEDAFNEIAPAALEEAVKENNLEVVSRPNIDITQIEKGKDVIFTAVMQTKPEVELGKYKGIEVKKIEYNVTDKDIEEELKHMQEHNSRLVTVEDRAVKKGDIAVIDFEGFVDDKAFEGGKGENYELEIGSNTFIPGFEDQVIGMQVDEGKDVKVKFPEEYFSKDLAGKDAVFKVTVHEIKKKELPKLDDEFAKDVSEFDTLEELKKDIKEKKEKENADKTKYETEDAVIKAVCENLKVEIPSGMIETETENMLKDIEQRLSYQGLKLDQYLKMMGKTEEEMKKEYEPQAIDAIKSRLTLEKVIELEKIEATDKEVEEKIEEMAKNYGKTADDFKNNENIKEYLKQGILNEKAVEFLVNNAKMK
jgi:trigger factor